MTQTTTKKKKKSILPNYKPILKSLREYKGDSIKTPLFIAFEVLFETAIPMVMAMMISEIELGISMTPILTYGLALVLMAIVSLTMGISSGKYGAKASTGLDKVSISKESLKSKVESFLLFFTKSI